MARFTILQEQHPDADPFDRQRRIAWWQQDRLRNARILVLGAGAIGNEVIKNLALLGCGYMCVADFDTISPSNLSRTVLFRTEDVGRRKAEVAADRGRELTVEPTARIDWFHGDIVWELGIGVFRRFDLVLGCLDNVETRFHTNRRSWLTGTPWIDGGIHELSVRVNVYQPPATPCWECNASPDQLTGVRRRYSCDEFKRRAVQEERVATVQIAAALAAALQVQESVKMLCGMATARGSRIHYQGTINDFDVIPLKSREACPAHLAYPHVVSLSLAAKTSVRRLLETVSTPERGGPGAVLVLRDRAFVLDAPCRVCGARIVLNRPSFRIFDDELLCHQCAGSGSQDGAGRASDPPTVVSPHMLNVFGLATTPDWILDMSLETLGVPALHIAEIKCVDGRELYYELSADESTILPGLHRPNAGPGQTGVMLGGNHTFAESGT
jgi:molybdopterin/thiamine biosynthesis adenylyltransferase